METEYPFHTAALLLLATIVAIRMYYHGYADAASGVRQTMQGEGIFKIIRILLGVPLAAGFVVYILWPPWMDWAHIELSNEVRWSGAIVGLLGVIMLGWLHKHLSRNFTGTVQIRPNGHVVTTGPYAYVRHPMYIAFMLFALSMLLLTANWLLGGGLFLIFLIVIVVRTPIEERALEDAYGDEYRAYKRKTGAFFPRFF
jgi:protein-S-isoprenylcysteine O-methyltransferase Ste14